MQFSDNDKMQQIHTSRATVFRAVPAHAQLSKSIHVRKCTRLSSNTHENLGTRPTNKYILLRVLTRIFGPKGIINNSFKVHCSLFCGSIVLFNCVNCYS